MDEPQFGFLGIPAFDCLCGLGFLLLSLCYLRTNTCFPVLRNQRDLQQQHGRAKRRSRGRTFKGWRTCQREAAEGRKLLAVLKGPPGRHYDTVHFRQLLCPDPLCEVCNAAAAKVGRLLSLASLEGAAISLASTGRAAESSSSAVSRRPHTC